MSLKLDLLGLFIYLALAGYFAAFVFACFAPVRSVRGGILWAARASYAFAFTASAAAVVWRGWSTGHPPMQNLFEFLLVAGAVLPLLTTLSRRFDGEEPIRVDAALAWIVLFPCGFVLDGAVKHLMPALQSPFFVPHVGAYVLGYLILLRAAFGVGRRLVGLGFFLLTLGLVLGAVWGKVCWGGWWQFDPKEMWSLATWLVYAASFHFHARYGASRPRLDRAFLVLGVVLVVLTLTWINFSRYFAGVHSYA